MGHLRTAVLPLITIVLLLPLVGRGQSALPFDELCRVSWEESLVMVLVDQQVCSLASIDADGDASPDLVLATIEELDDRSTWSAKLQLLLGGSSGQYARTQVVAEVTGAASTWGLSNYDQGFLGDIRVCDIDDDSNQDVVVLSQRSLLEPMAFDTHLHILWGGSEGAFQEKTINIPDMATFSLSELAVADLDGDGIADIAVPDFRNARILLYWGVEGREFTQPTELAFTNPYPTTVREGDMDGNGVDDLVVGGFYDDGARRAQRFVQLAIFGSDREVVMGKATRYGWPEPTLQRIELAVADLNKDGLPDVLANYRHDVVGGIGPETQGWAAQEGLVALTQQSDGTLAWKPLGWVGEGEFSKLLWVSTETESVRLIAIVPWAAIEVFEGYLDSAAGFSCTVPEYTATSATVVPDPLNSGRLTVLIARETSRGSVLVRIALPQIAE